MARLLIFLAWAGAWAIAGAAGPGWVRAASADGSAERYHDVAVAGRQAAFILEKLADDVRNARDAAEVAAALDDCTGRLERFDVQVRHLARQHPELRRGKTLPAAVRDAREDFRSFLVFFRPVWEETVGRKLNRYRRDPGVVRSAQLLQAAFVDLRTTLTRVSSR